MKVLWPVFVAMLLCGCQAEKDNRCARLPGDGRYCLQPTTRMAEFSLLQQVVIVFGEQRETLIMALEVEPGAMRVLGLTPFGQKVMELAFDDAAIHVKAAPAARHFDFAMLMALVQVSLWPAEAVRAGLSAGYTIEESPGRRHIASQGKDMLTVEYEGTVPRHRRVRVSVPALRLMLEAVTLDDAGEGVGAVPGPQ